MSTYDAVNRVSTRQRASPPATGTPGFTDAPADPLDANGNVTASFIGLPGGTTVTVRSSINRWSYPDLHGNYTVPANSSGVRQAISSGASF